MTVVVADVVDTQYGDSRPIVGGAAGTDDQNYTPNLGDRRRPRHGTAAAAARTT